MSDQPATRTWIVRDPEGGLRMVSPADRAGAAEREISAGWQEVASAGDFEALVSWVLEVGERNGWPLDEGWVRHTFADLVDDAAAGA